ncbi:MAG: hypothetical protein QXW00_03145 [Candidatus Woesearchaeota archaeon]
MKIRTRRIRFDFKERGGKLLRASALILKEKIISIRLSGDFFIYPEEAIFRIEQALQGSSIKDVSKILTRHLKRNRIKIIGFTPEGLQTALESAVRK